MKKLRFIPLALAPLLLSACALQSPPSAVSTNLPTQWMAPLPGIQPVAGLPHQGTLTDLSRWWEQQGDPLLVELINAAQAVSPSVASARSRIEQSRASRVAAGAALLPSLDASASVSRGRSQPVTAARAPVGTSSQLGLQTAWELDVFGGRRDSRDAAQLRYEGAQAQWHDARVLVAAETANQYYGLRTCGQLLRVARSDAASRAETGRLAQLSADAGFTAPATAALGRASAADANSRATQQAALCELDIKALVALSSMPEPELRQKLASAPTRPAQTATVLIANVPAQALAQRPDVFSAEREVAAASADVGSAQAARYPRLTLNGSVAANTFRSGSVSTDFNTWSIGPLALSLPLFDGGRRAADAEAAQARYDEAAAVYRGRVRQAVREVEEALVTLQSTAARGEDARIAAEGYRAAFAGTEALYKNGLASLVDLEDSRRTQLAAETALLSLQRERSSAWVALYRAMGGGWTRELEGPGGPAVVTGSTPRQP
ncbi:efflux transporter outer membrane subunit [Polaromonas eurypsychrophila]|uniref:Membrane protein n=1 Tax=Polaromonas eurypsychrophila TaxID=1614635 RepID=A0A916S797_9BURK|nr:efflux transporter outer membrane subunit [Polaromonas eurypsychrophila]GGA88044.1 membrane protein [Polaromonas eurypsychrophila]